MPARQQADLVVDRATVLAFRAAAHGFARSSPTAAAVPGIGLGLQDSPPGSARLALAVRVAASQAAAAWDADPGLTVAWSLRGAPHVHRRGDLPALAAALWPHDDADAAARLAWNAGRVAASGRPAAECLSLAAQAVADVAADAGGAPLSKGALSAEVTRRLPAELSRFCEPCGSVHVHEQLLRLAALPGGLAVTGSAPLEFSPVPGWPGVPAEPVGTDQLVRAYLRLYGPATPADVKAFLGCTTAVAQAAFPADAVPVDVVLGGPTGGATGGTTRRAWVLAEDAALLADPPDPPAVRLVPPNDAFLKAGDRAVLVPDRVEQKAIWRVLGSPGVLLLDAVPAGIWRPKATSARLDLTVESFVPLPDGARAAVGDEAARLAAVRGLAPGHVVF